MNKVKFRWGEETYTLCVTQDDCWLEDGPSDISDRMLKGMDELAMENGMLPPKGLCAECWKGTYEAIVEDYHIGGETIKDLDLERCPRCRHTILPWQSVERVDKVLEALKKPAELCPTCRKSNTIEFTGDLKMDSVCKLNGEPFSVQNITRTQCPKCKDEFFFMSECEKIEAAIQAEQKRRGLN